MKRTQLALVVLAAAALLSHLRSGAMAAGSVVPVDRFWTDRESAVDLALPEEQGAFGFTVFGDRTGGPAEGIAVLEQAVRDANLLGPDLVMTVGDLINGYNQTPEWLLEMREFQRVMNGLDCPWFPVAGNHDTYWRGPEGERPFAEHDAEYEQHFGPLWYAFRHKGSAFVVLYTDEGDPTTGKKEFRRPEAQGMSAAQMSWLEGTLERTADARHVFVFLHHPRWIGGGYGDDWERVHSMLADAGNVRAVFAGHIHRMRYDGPRDGIEYFTLATVGGHQSGVVPRAGFLHHYEHVTVRDDRIAVTSVPVGSAQDPRQITALVTSETQALAQSLSPRWLGAVVLEGDLSVDASLEVEFENPTSRGISVDLDSEGLSPGWRISPQGVHLELGAGETARASLHIGREAQPIGPLARAPEFELRVEYHAESMSVDLPARSLTLPMEVAGLPEPAAPAHESVLWLDGVGACLAVEDAQLSLPGGPFTLEGWVLADQFGERQGFLNKTEQSEYGIFLNRGRPSFMVHLGGQYFTAEAAEPLGVGEWHHVAGVFDGLHLRLFVDGSLVASASGTPGAERTRNALPLIVGGDVSGQGGVVDPLRGQVDEVRLSSVARYVTDGFEPERRLVEDEKTALLLHMDGSTFGYTFDSSPAGAHPGLRGRARVGPGELSSGLDR